MEGGRNLRSVTVEDAAEHLGVGVGTLGVPTQPIVFAISSARISTTFFGFSAADSTGASASNEHKIGIFMGRWEFGFLTIACVNRNT